MTKVDRTPVAILFAALTLAVILAVGVPSSHARSSWSLKVQRAHQTQPTAPRPPVVAHKANGPCNSFAHIYVVSGSYQIGHGYADCGYDTYEQVTVCLRSWLNLGSGWHWYVDSNTCHTGFTASGGVNAYTSHASRRGIWRDVRAQFGGAYPGWAYSSQQYW